MTRVTFLKLSALLVFPFAFWASCAPTLVVKSEPSQATVFWVDPVSTEKKDLGKTPLQLTGESLRQLYGGKPPEGESIQLLIEKPGYASQSYLVPATPFGALSTTLLAKLPSGVGDQSAHEVLAGLFRAQKFAVQKDYERALIEVDKILVAYPGFAPALSMRGSIAYIRRDYPQALKDYEAALKADANWDEAIEMIAHIKQLRGAAPRAPAGGASGP